MGTDWEDKTQNKKMVKSETSDATGEPRVTQNPHHGKIKDAWVTRENGKWERRHAIPRRALFTPFKVPGGPSKNVQFQYLRLTVGRYVNTGEDFRIVDNWSQPENAHIMLAGSWVGTTTYREAADFLVEGPSISSLQRVEKVDFSLGQVHTHHCSTQCHDQQNKIDENARWGKYKLPRICPTKPQHFL